MPASPPADDRAEEEDWISSLEEAAAKVQRALEPYQGALCISLGAIACLYGRHFTYSVLFWRAFGASGWPAARRSAAEIRQRLLAAKAAVRRDFSGGLPTLQEAGDAARQTVGRLQVVHEAYQSVQQGVSVPNVQTLATEVTALQSQLGTATSRLAAVSAELQPERLMELWRSIHAGILASLSAAMLDASALLGLSGNIGEAVARTVNRAVAPCFHRLLDRAVARSSPEVQQLREDPTARRWVELAVDFLCNSVGIGAAFIVEARLFAISNVRAGARIIAREVCGRLHGSSSSALEPDALAPKPYDLLPGQCLLEWLLFGGGMYLQFFRGAGGPWGVLWHFCWGARRMSCAARLLLAGPLMTETWLQTAVAAMRTGAA